MLTAVLITTGLWGIRFLDLRRSIIQYRSYWCDRNDDVRGLPYGGAPGVLYIALGDSTAQGIGASAPELGYVGRIAARLRATTRRPVRVLNLSRSGARVREVVDEQLPRLRGLAPDLVTVAVGANDIRHYDPDRFRTDVDALIAGLPPQAVIADVPWFMHGVPGRKSGEAAAYVAQRAQAAALPVADLYRTTRNRGWTAMLTDFAADWFHPNDRGHRIWAGAFWRAIEGAGSLSGR